VTASSPRVVHVAPASFGPHGVVGGGERYVVELARAMAAQVPTTLVTFGPRANSYRLGALEGEVLRNWIPFRSWADPFNPTFLSRLRNADIIHCHQPRMMMPTLALFYGTMKHIPVFTTNLGASGMFLHTLVDLRHWYDGHLHISDFSRQVYGHSDLASARVIFGGVDTSRFSPDPAVEASRDVLFVGRLLPHKGINYLIDAMDGDSTLTIAGRRWLDQEGEFNRLIRTLAEGKHVRFDDACDDDALPDLYRRSLCTVLPSVYVTVGGDKYPVSELLGQTLLESMACGRPAICTNVGGMPEVVRDGLTGFVVPPNDPVALREKINWLREHPAEADAMGRAARADVLERFSWSAVVDRCLDAYRRVLTPSGSTARHAP
jgi:glycosyltransferase involved in cell wall biosynthesis